MVSYKLQIERRQEWMDIKIVKVKPALPIKFTGMDSIA
jgi:hypothetical protein